MAEFSSLPDTLPATPEDLKTLGQPAADSDPAALPDTLPVSPDDLKQLIYAPGSNFQPTADQAWALKQADESRPVSEKVGGFLKAIPEGFKGLAENLGTQAGKASVELPQAADEQGRVPVGRMLGTAAEAGAQAVAGVRAPMAKLLDYLERKATPDLSRYGVRNDDKEVYHKQFLARLEEERALQAAQAGETPLLGNTTFTLAGGKQVTPEVPASLAPLPATASLASNFIDPSLPAGIASGVVKRVLPAVAEAGLKDAAVNAAGRTLGEKVAGAAGTVVKKAGELLQKPAALADAALDSAVPAATREAVSDAVHKAGTLAALAGLSHGGPTGLAMAGIATAKKLSTGFGWTVEQAGDFLQRLAATEGNSQVPRLLQIAKDKSAPEWLRGLGGALHKAGVGAGAEAVKDIATGAAHGAAMNAGLALAGQETPEEIGGAAGTGAGFGVAGHLAFKLTGSSGRSKAIQNRLGDLGRLYLDQKEQGVPDEVIHKIDTTPALLASALQASTARAFFGRDLKFKFVGGNDFNAASPGNEGGAASFDPQSNSVLVNVDSNRPEATTHEIGHAVAKAVGADDQARLTIDSVFSPEQLQALGTEYAQKMVNSRLRAEGKDPATLTPEDQAKLLAGQIQSLNQTHGGDKWLYDEIYAEAAYGGLLDKDLKALVGKDPVWSRLGDSIKEKFLDAAGALPEQGVPRNALFTDPAVYQDPALRKMVLEHLRSVYNEGPNDKIGKETKEGVPAGAPIAPELIGKHPAAPVSPNPQTGRMENDFAVVKPSGEVTMRRPSEVRKIERTRRQEVQGVIGKEPVKPKGDTSADIAPRVMPSGKIETVGTKISGWLDKLVTFGEEAKKNAKVAEGMMDSGDALETWYQAIGHGPGWAASVRRSLGNIAASKVKLAPFLFKVSKEGNVLVVGLSLTSAERKIAKWGQDKNSKLALLWGGDVASFRQDLMTYLKNHADGRPGADSIGEKKRDALNTFVIGQNVGHMDMNPLRESLTGENKNGIIRSLRLDRMATAQPAPDKGWHAEYEKKVLNLSPDSAANDILDDAKGAREADTTNLVDEGHQTVSNARQFSPASEAGASMNTTKQAEKLWKEKGVESLYFKRWFGDSKVVGDDKKPLVVFHGTTHDFDKFDINRTNPENDFGKGFYFTSDRGDALMNYAGRGPDLTNRIDSRAEQIFSEKFSDKDEPAWNSAAYKAAMKKAKAQAAKELEGPTSKTIQAYVKIENPLVLKKNGGTRFEMSYDEDTGQESGSGMELYNSLLRVGQEFGVDGLKVWGEVSENGLDGTTAREVVDAMKKSDTLVDTADEQGRSLHGEFIRRVFEDMGFDGVIYEEPAKHFPRMGIPESAKHFIAFNPEQVKSVENQGTFDEKDARYQFSPDTKEGEDVQLKGKLLPHAVGPTPIEIVHYSGQPGLTKLSPKFFGQGKSTPSDLRGGEKTFAFVKGSDFGQDANIFQSNHAYAATIDGSRIYDLSKGKPDPEGYFSTINREEADDNLRSKGYAGILVDTKDNRKVVMLYRPVKVKALGEGGSGKAKKVGGEPWYSPDVETKQGRKEPNEEVRKVAEGYAEQAGIAYEPHTGYDKVDEAKAKRIADAYETAKHNPDDPAVKAAYDAFSKETVDQWNYITAQGVKMEPWTKEGQPYKNSAEMTADVRENKHLWFFPTEGGFGSTDVSTHPLLTPSGVSANGKPLLVNDLFRAVHDYFGHAKEGYEFGPRGEYNAYLTHSKMYSEAARPAMAAETLAPEEGEMPLLNAGQRMIEVTGPNGEKYPARFDGYQEVPAAMGPHWPQITPVDRFPFQGENVRHSTTYGPMLEASGLKLPKLPSFEEWEQAKNQGGYEAKQVGEKVGLFKKVSNDAKEVFKLHEKNGGATFNPATGKSLSGEPVFAVSIYPDRSVFLDRPATEADIRDFIRKNQDLLSKPENSVGTWNDTKTGKTYLDVSVTVPDRDFAKFLGERFNQKAIFDLKTFDEIPTGGTGENVHELPSADERVATAQKEFKGQSDLIKKLFSPDVEDPIVSPAIKLADGEILQGGAHALIVINNLEKFPGEDFGIDGFVTKSGKFLNREQAYDHAVNQQQISRPEYHAALGVETPALESMAFRQTRAYSPDHDAAEDFFTRVDNNRNQVMQEFLSLPEDSDKGVSWNRIPAARLKRIWLDFGKSGVLRDTKGVEKIADQVLENIARIKAVTELVGHETYDVKDMLEQNGIELTDKQWDRFYNSDFITDQFSDYAMKPLEALYVQLYKAETPEDKLQLIDRVLNVVHQRGDIADLFVQGGTKTLDEIASQGGYSEGSKWNEGAKGQRDLTPKNLYSPDVEVGLPGMKLDEPTIAARKLVALRVAKAKDKFPESRPIEYQKDAEGKVIIGQDGKPKPVSIDYDLANTPLAREAAKGLRGDERETAFASALGDKLVKFYKKVAENPDIAAGAKWYSTCRTRLKKVFGDDSKFFAELLGATSARTPVQTNFEFSLDAYNKFKAGDYDAAITKYREGKAKWDARDLGDFIKATGNDNPTRSQFLDWWVETNKLKPRQSNGKLFGANSRAVLRVLDGTWREEVQGPKTPNFAGNMTGDTFEATIDVWAMRALHRLANEGGKDRWRILPENETGVSDADFYTGQKAFRHAAEKLGIKPDALQAVLWFAEKDHWEKRGWTRGAGAEKSDFNSLLADTERGHKGEFRLKTPQVEMNFSPDTDAKEGLTPNGKKW